MNFISNLPLRKYLFAYILSFALSLVLLAVVSIIFSFFPPPEFLLDALYNYFFLVPAFTAAFLWGRASRGRGFLTGLIAADFYVLLLTVLGGIIFKNSISPAELTKLFIPASLCGALGGILGINFK